MPTHAACNISTTVANDVLGKNSIRGSTNFASGLRATTSREPPLNFVKNMFPHKRQRKQLDAQRFYQTGARNPSPECNGLEPKWLRRWSGRRWRVEEGVRDTQTEEHQERMTHRARSRPQHNKNHMDKTTHYQPCLLLALISGHHNASIFSLLPASPASMQRSLFRTFSPKDLHMLLPTCFGKHEVRTGFPENPSFS